MIVCKLLATVALAIPALLPPPSNAISCYDCVYKNSTDAKDSKCSEPFDPSTAPKCDTYDMCFMKWTNENSDYTVRRECLNSSLGLTVDQCSVRSKQDNTFFVYKKMCCQSTGKRDTPSSTSSSAQCWCQTDYCNGNTPFSSDTTQPPISTDNRSPISAQLPVYPLLLLAVIIATLAKTSF